jgi:hypothetical protein
MNDALTDYDLSVMAFLQEIRGYLVASADGSMSRNNSEQLASELLDNLDNILKSE